MKRQSPSHHSVIDNAATLAHRIDCARIAFEAWAGPNNADLRRDHNTTPPSVYHYDDPVTEAAWWGYCAALRLI